MLLLQENNSLQLYNSELLQGSNYQEASGEAWNSNIYLKTPFSELSSKLDVIITMHSAIDVAVWDVFQSNAVTQLRLLTVFLRT